MAFVLVTGAGGFLGRHLCEALRPAHRVLGAVRRGLPRGDVPHTVIGEGEGALADVVRKARPDFVVHSAFLNRRPPGVSVSQYVQSVVAVNAPLFEAVAEIDARLLLVSSSAVYAPRSTPTPIAEEFCRGPVSLYGVAKCSQELLAEHYRRASGLRLCVVRPFNLCGPGQQKGMLLPDWVNAAVAIARGGEPVLEIRNRASSRDFVDVRDACRGIVALIAAFPEGQTFNLASGAATSLVEIAEALARLTPVPFRIVESDPSLDATDVSFQVGSADRIAAQVGWKPAIDWQTSLRDLWNEYWQSPDA